MNWIAKESVINKKLKNYLKPDSLNSRELLRLMNYSLLGQGKRIRPILMLEAAEVLGKNWQRFLDAACGVEMIHVSSLILDDLPCMDDALTRRGKPALHRVEGEANAILASYALLTSGIRLIAQNACDSGIDGLQFSQAIRSICDAAGIRGISLGQFLDLNLTQRRYSKADIERIHRYKTASLFISSLEIAAMLAKAKKGKLLALKKYGRNIGLAFQIRDDLFDWGKKTKDSGKSSLKGDLRPNYAHLVGREESKKRLHYLIGQANLSLRIFGRKAEPLRDLASFIEEREK